MNLVSNVNLGGDENWLHKKICQQQAISVRGSSKFAWQIIFAHYGFVISGCSRSNSGLFSEQLVLIESTAFSWWAVLLLVGIYFSLRKVSKGNFSHEAVYVISGIRESSRRIYRIISTGDRRRLNEHHAYSAVHSNNIPWWIAWSCSNVLT